MRKILIILLSFFVLSIQTSALTMHVEGNHVNDVVKVTLDKPSFAIFKIDNGTPIYAEGSEVAFIPHVTGKLCIEAIHGDEKVSKTVSIVKAVKTEKTEEITKIGENRNFLPQGEFTKKIDGKNYRIKWRTALGALEKASKIKDFSYVLEKKSWGLYVKCIKDKCEKSEGFTSGWMYWVNYPRDPLPGVSADLYEIKGGDKIVWYFSRSMDETPETSPYKIEIYVSKTYDVSVKIVWGKKETKAKFIKGETQRGSLSAKEETEIIQTITSKFNIVNLTLKPSQEIKLKSIAAKDHFSRSVYKAFELNTNKPAIGFVEFRVSKEWLKTKGNPEDVILMDLNNGDLKTKLIEEDSEYYYYRSNITSPGMFAITVKWRGFPLNVTDAPIIKALKWLRSIQNKDGGFSNPGEESSVSKTSWAIMALVAAKQDLNEWKKEEKTPLDYLKENINESIDKMGTADYARTILALKAANKNPRNFNGIDFVAKLKSKIKDNGQIGDFIYTTIWGVLALNACGENTTKSVEWLIKQQNEDGGFAWAVGEKSDYDDTAAAIQALISSGVDKNSEVIKKALEYLKTGQNDDGGFRYFGNSASNAASDAWIIQALVAAGENPMKWRKNNISVVDHLLSLQTDEGYFKYTNIQTSNPGYMTVCAIMALLGKPHPIKAENESIELIELEGEKVNSIETKPINQSAVNQSIEQAEKQVKSTIEEKKEQKTPGFGIIAAMLAIAIVLLRKKT